MITIYGHNQCTWCTKAKQLADSYDLKYEYRNIYEPGIKDELVGKLPNVRTVPQIWWDDRHIGGYEQFASEIENTISGHANSEL